MAKAAPKAPETPSLAQTLAGIRGDLEARVNALRDQIAETQARLEHASEGYLPRDEYAGRVSAWLDSQAEAFAQRAEYQVSSLRVPGPPQAVEFGALPVRGGQVVGGAIAEANIAPLLAWLLGDVLKAKLKALIEATPYKQGPPSSDRARLRSELQTQLDSLELREEALVMEAESIGLTLAPRPDCRPDIVLSLELAENT